jgi:hypothetical protein
MPSQISRGVRSAVPVLSRAAGLSLQFNAGPLADKLRSARTRPLPLAWRTQRRVPPDSKPARRLSFTGFPGCNPGYKAPAFVNDPPSRRRVGRLAPGGPGVPDFASVLPELSLRSM